jgi:hypothetical protein
VVPVDLDAVDAARTIAAGVVKNGRRELPARVAIDARAIDEYGTWGVGGKSQGGATPSATRYRTTTDLCLSLPEFGAEGWAKPVLEGLIRNTQLARSFVVGDDCVSRSYQRSRSVETP